MPSTINRSKTKTPMPAQDPKKRSKNFGEVALGYTQEDAINEARRCLNCKKPTCMQGCPVKVNAQFIKHMANKTSKGHKHNKTNQQLPAICGRVCPRRTMRTMHTNQNGRPRSHEPRALCSRLGREQGIKTPEQTPSVGKSSHNRLRPCRLTCAGDLAKIGYEVTFFEAFHDPGELVIYGIPEFRLPKQIVKQEVDFIKQLGAKVKTTW